MASKGWRHRVGKALAAIEAGGGDPAAYRSAIEQLLQTLTRTRTTEQCAQEIAEALVASLALEGCAVALADGAGGPLVLAGLGTQGSPRVARDAGWPALASRMGHGPRCFRPGPDGGFDAVPPGELGGEGFLVLPVTIPGEADGALVLHSRTAPAAPPLALLAQISGQVLALARVREALAEACSDDVRPALGSDGVKGDLIGTVSHELRTPLNAILGYAALLREGTVGSVTREQTALLDRVLSNTRSLNTLIDDILLLVQLDAERLVVRRQRVRATELIEAVVAELPERPGVEPVSLRVDVVPQDTVLHVDATLLHRLLLQLLANALKFTVRGEVTLAVRAGGKGGTVTIAVRDTGPGISPERLDALRAFFAESGATPSQRHPGVGMGLTLVQRCVRLLGGDVAVESRPGGGSEFRVRIPGALQAAGGAASTPVTRTVH